MADLISMLAAAAGASAGGEYQISRSLRFNSADSAYLSRSFAGTPQTFTFSAWFKRSGLGGFQFLAASRTSGGNASWIGFNTSNQLYVGLTDTTIFTTTAVYRDVSAWYHVLLSVTQSGTTNCYINNVLAGTGSSTANSNLFNSTRTNTIGRYGDDNQYYFNGYMTEVHFVDGQALTPSDFGETDATTGVWKPKAYTGTYGTNGFYLDFSDNSSTTTLGYDAAGSNDWTLNNFSVTAGAGNDSLVDTPTPYGTDTGVGGEVRGNYATLNAVSLWRGSGATTLSNGNLQNICATSSATGGAPSTIAISSGKFYWEIEFDNVSGTNTCGGGIYDTSVVFGGGNTWIVAGHWILGDTGSFYANGAAGTASGTGSFSSGDIAMFAFDGDSGDLWVGKNGSWVGTPGVSGEIATLTMSGKSYAPLSTTYNTSAVNIVNFGQRPFAYTAPSGFKALCTQNIAEGTITTSGTFTGNGSTDGPFVYLNGVPTAMTIDGNAVTFGTHADKLANGFKVRSSSASYNANATSMSYTISTTGAKFKYANAQPNP